jgi:hypothetical protein
MNKSISIAVCASLMALPCLQADVSTPYTGATVSFTSFYKVTGGVFDNLPDSYYTILSDSNMSGATHILVENLELNATSSTLICGDFDAVNASTAEVVATGLIGFNYDSADEIDGSYPIVGVIPLSNGFSNSDLTSTSNGGEFDGRSASVSYNPDIGAMKVTMDSTSSYLSYVENEGTGISIEAPFIIADDSASITFTDGFAGANDDGAYTGMISADLSSGISNIYKVTFTDSNDADSDGLSDLFDPDNYWYANSSSYYDDGDFYSNWFGQMSFCYTPRWNDTMDDYDPADHGWVWHYNHGYLYGYNYVDANGTKWAFFYDFNLGWWVTSESVFPLIYAYDATIDGTSYGGSWLYYAEDTGSTTSYRYFYGYNSSLKKSTNCNAKGWWMVRGAN